MADRQTYTQAEIDVLVAQVGKLVQVLEAVLNDAYEDHGYYVIRPTTLHKVREALHGR